MYRSTRQCSAVRTGQSVQWYTKHQEERLSTDTSYNRTVLKCIPDALVVDWVIYSTLMPNIDNKNLSFHVSL